MTHSLKTWPEYFKDVLEGKKTFESRKDDRPFKEGDMLELMEYDPESNSFSGETIIKDVTYVLRNAPGFGLKEGYFIMGLGDPEM